MQQTIASIQHRMTEERHKMINEILSEMNVLIKHDCTKH